MAETKPRLLAPITVRGITAKNRIVVSPMCIYSAQRPPAFSRWSLRLGLVLDNRR
jgi:2,4-dienoyl-CoA reductase-like NADH-dependent reductase (Old Yellow Enzyme family)